MLGGSGRRASGLALALVCHRVHHHRILKRGGKRIKIRNSTVAAAAAVASIPEAAPAPLPRGDSRELLSHRPAVLGLIGLTHAPRPREQALQRTPRTLRALTAEG